MTTIEKVKDRLYDLGYMSECYDIEAMASDIDNGNFDLDEAADFRDYFTRNIVVTSFLNGQRKQAKEQADAYGLDYDKIVEQVESKYWVLS